MDQIQEVKDKLDVVAVISSYFPLTKSGKNYKALCPFHTEKTPSFMVSPELQIFKCFGCGEGGDVIAFYSKMEGVSFGEALGELAKRAGVRLIRRKKTPEEERRETIFQINQLAADYFHHLLMKHRIGEKARKFLKKRGLAKESIETFDLGYAPSSWDSLGRFILSKNYTLTDYLASGLGIKKEGGRGFYDFFRGRVVFPLRSSTGRVVGFSARTLVDEEPKYINGPETPAFKKRRFLYNLDLAKRWIKKKREVILVEGEMDVIALFEKGIKNVVASKGTALTPEQLAFLTRFADSVRICFDKDAAGLEATKKGIMLAQGVGLEVRAVLMPAGKDPDEAIRTDGAAFRRALEKAPPIFDFYLESALERFETKTASGKKKVAAELLPVLKGLANEVEKATYLKKLSEAIDVPEESLWKQLEKEEALEVSLPRRVPAGTRPRRTGVKVGERPRIETKEALFPTRRIGGEKRRFSSKAKEAYLLTLVLSLPFGVAKKWLRKLSPGDFSGPQLREIFVKLKVYLARIKRFRLSNFSAKLTEEQRKILEELTLLPPPLRGISPEREIEAAIRVVKKACYKRELRELVGAVKEAEKGQKAREVKRLQKEVLKLSKKIRKL